MVGRFGVEVLSQIVGLTLLEECMKLTVNKGREVVVFKTSS